MPINKNAMVCYNTLNKCFSNLRRKYYFEDLLEACNDALMNLGASEGGIKRRQLFSDIQFMKSEAGFAAPIISIYEDKRPYYRYEDKDFSISQRPMNTEEAEIMRVALTTLSRFKGLPQFEWVNEIIPKIEFGFQLTTSNDSVMSFQAGEYLKGLEFLGELYTKIVNKSVIKLNYHPFSKPIEKHIIHPYFLKQFNTRWYLLGYNEDYDAISIFALDRMEGFVDVNKAYIDSTINFDEYFEDVVGVSIPKDGLLQNVTLRFSPKLMPYILSNPIHSSQKHIKNTDILQISLKVIPNFELQKLILSFGSECTIIEPLSLKNSIQIILEESLNNYHTKINYSN